MLFLLLMQCSLQAQDKLNIKFGKVKPEDFDVKSLLIDSSTNAVIVADLGKSSFVANTNDRTFSLVFLEKKRIKVINKNGFDAATITIPLYVDESNKAEELQNVDASTYNIENGKVVETKVGKSSVFTEKHSKHWIYKKFTFPALKEGSIIEYSYEVKSDFFFNLQPWTFQAKYPVLWSQYDAGIPEFFDYVTLTQGYQPLFINKVNHSQVSFTFVERVERDPNQHIIGGTALNNFKVDGSIENHTWVMRDVPALKEEPFTTTLRNSIAKIEFQLKQIKYPNTPPKSYLNSWENVGRDLMADEKFGVPINKPNNWLDNTVESIVKASTSKREMAQRIYEYVRDNFTSNNSNSSIYVTTDLKDVFKNKSGSVADINLLLIAMLKNRKIEVNPVILSTRDNGFTDDLYPFITRYNYVIARVEIDNTTLYLDASSRQLSFGRCASNIYNGQAREITKNLAHPIYFVADSLNETAATIVFIYNQAKGAVEGSISHNLGIYESMQFRNKMTKTLLEDYKKSLQQDYSEEIEIGDLQIDSLKILSEPVVIRADLKFKTFGESDIVYFNPMLAEAKKVNPFVALQRFYPVEMPYKIDEVYTLSMEIPTGYKVEEMPKSTRLSLNEDEGMFEYLISQNGANIQMRCRLVLRKANYLNEDYQSLREFYGFIVKKEAEQIVFKKLK
ncbi:MAG: transglutaminase domain-containing protein [Ferruginibacter sp.]